MKKSKLRLQRQTVRVLSSTTLSRVAGGTEEFTVVDGWPTRQSCDSCGMLCTYSAYCSVSCGCPTQLLSCAC